MRTLIPLFAVLGALTACDSIPDERLGPYRSEEAGIISVRASVSGESLELRFFETGRLITLSRDGERWRNGDEISLTFADGGLRLSDGMDTVFASRLDLVERRHDVDRDGVMLHTHLRLPTSPGPHPVVVIIQGSGEDAATRTYATPDFFVANGIGAAVYDKRGTGHSSGEYNYDFEMLARDAIAVIEWVKDQPDVDAARIGVSGYSQGGWVGPLAASRSRDVGFVVVNYGMIDSPRDEARIETVATLARRGHTGEHLDHVAELAEAAVDIMAADFGDGWDRFDTIAERYADEPWVEDLAGTTPGEFLSYPEWVVRIAGPMLSPGGLDWDYTSMDALDELARRSVPSVWMIADRDRSAPNEFTLAELGRRIDRGEPIRLHVFENTDHGFRVIESEDETGERTYGDYHPDRFETEVRFIQALARTPE